MSLGVFSGSQRGRPQRPAARPRPLGDLTSWLDDLERVPTYDELRASAPTLQASSTGGSLPAGVPGQWWPDARVKKLQELLNVELGRAGCTTKLAVDGLIGPAGCGALEWATKVPIGTDLQALLAAYGQNFAAGCKYVTAAHVAPTCPAPQPAVATSLPFPVNTVNATARSWQSMLNAELGARGLPLVPVTGAFDQGTCQGLARFQRSYQAAPNDPVPADDFAAVMGQYFPAAVTACNAMSTTAAAPPPPPPPPAPLTATDVLALQAGLNTEVLGPRSLTLVPVDGKLSKATCGAANYVISSVKAGTLSVSGPLTTLLNKAALPLGCDPLYPWTAPSKVVAAPPPPAPLAAPTVTEVMLLQKLLNTEVLGPGRFVPLAEDGKLSPLVCGAAGGTLNDVQAGKLKVSAPLASLLVSTSLRAACGKLGPIVFPAKLPTPVVAPPPVAAPKRDPSLPPLNASGECIIDYGRTWAEVKVIQTQLNAALAKAGYLPVPLTGTWDAATCGALFALGGKFVPASTKACPNAYSVALSCPSMKAPTKKVVAPPPKPVITPPPVKQAGMGALGVGLLAAAAVGGVYYAKKKGLIG